LERLGACFVKHFCDLPERVRALEEALRSGLVSEEELIELLDQWVDGEESKRSSAVQGAATSKKPPAKVSNHPATDGRMC
jgi:hypothetical protein